MRKYSYWLAQNTGWSGGVSWFDNYEGTRYKTKDQALACAEKFKKNHPDSKHRIVYRSVQESEYEI